MERLGNDIFGSLPGGNGRNALKRAIQVQRIWGEALGDPLAQELRPGKVDGDTLQIFTSSSTWLSEARFLERRILRALEKAAPGLGIRKAKIRLDPAAGKAGQDPGPAPESAPAPRELGPAEQARIRDIVERVRDPALRARLSRLFEKAAARAPEPVEEDSDGRGQRD